jgi:ATP-dependent exoDNAse (exonuclease V) beta subunit
LSDFDGFASQVRLLKAQSDPKADERLQVMTIHEAKGLQFDTVILPGLGRYCGRDDENLFLYHEGLMAPIKETGTDSDPIYAYLQEIEKRKSGNEAVRLLYVAATRAKKRLHLLGYAGANGKPCGGSMLAVLWDGLEAKEQQLFIEAAGAPAIREVQDAKPPAIRRLPAAWVPSPAPTPVEWEGSETEINEMRQPTFEWVGDSLRHAGTVVHALLQRMAKSREYRVNRAVIRTALAQLGVPAAELERTTRRVEDALARTLASTRGQWILAEHDLAQCEVPVSGVLDGKIVQGTVDRTFVDRDGTRWVIDFKTSAHEGGGLVDFLDEQQRRYRAQLERYGRLLNGLGQPVRLGLYFPLLNEWREWGI